MTTKDNNKSTLPIRLLLPQLVSFIGSQADSRKPEFALSEINFPDEDEGLQTTFRALSKRPDVGLHQDWPKPSVMKLIGAQ